LNLLFNEPPNFWAEHAARKMRMHRRAVIGRRLESCINPGLRKPLGASSHGRGAARGESRRRIDRYFLFQAHLRCEPLHSPLHSPQTGSPEVGSRLLRIQRASHRSNQVLVPFCPLRCFNVTSLLPFLSFILGYFGYWDDIYSFPVNC
jgi:hypothetical protein